VRREVGVPVVALRFEAYFAVSDEAVVSKKASTVELLDDSSLADLLSGIGIAIREISPMRQASESATRNHGKTFLKDRFSSLTGEVGSNRSATTGTLLSPPGHIEDRTNSVITQATTTPIQWTRSSTQHLQPDVRRDGVRTALRGCPADPSFVATAQGNIDADVTVDQWSISSNACVHAGGNCTPTRTTRRRAGERPERRQPVRTSQDGNAGTARREAFPRFLFDDRVDAPISPGRSCARARRGP